MTFDEYQKLAIKTINRKLSEVDRLDMLALGLRGESGEICEEIKKWRWHHNHEGLDEAKLLEEVGDVMWYCASVAETTGFKLSAAIREHAEMIAARNHNFNPKFNADSSKVLQRVIVKEAFEDGVDHKKGTPEIRADELSDNAHGLSSCCGRAAHDLTLMWFACKRTGATIEQYGNAETSENIAEAVIACVAFAITLNKDFEKVLIDNIRKLKKRYGSEFSTERSLHRKE